MTVIATHINGTGFLARNFFFEIYSSESQQKLMVVVLPKTNIITRRYATINWMRDDFVESNVRSHRLENVFHSRGKLCKNRMKKTTRKYIESVLVCNAGLLRQQQCVFFMLTLLSNCADESTFTHSSDEPEENADRPLEVSLSQIHGKYSKNSTQIFQHEKSLSIIYIL